MGILDNVGGFAKQAGDGIADAAENTSKVVSDAWNTAVEDAKAGANAVATSVRDADAKKQQLGAWIDSKEQQLEHKVDEGRPWLCQNGGARGGERLEGAGAGAQGRRRPHLVAPERRRRRTGCLRPGRACGRGRDIRL